MFYYIKLGKMNSYDTDEDFDELVRYIIDNETTDDDDIAEDLEDCC